MNPSFPSFVIHRSTTPVQLEFISPAGRNPPDRDSLVSHAYLALRHGKSSATLRVDLPNCCFPAYRADGAPSTISVANIEHPIARGYQLRTDDPEF